MTILLHFLLFPSFLKRFQVKYPILLDAIYTHLLHFDIITYPLRKSIGISM